MKKKVVVLGTGGTIAGRSEHGSDNVGYTAGQVGVQSLLQAIAPLQAALQGRELVTEQVAQVDSKDMGFSVWALLAQRCAHHLQEATVDAVLITHGTDTLEETSFFLEQVLPVALLQGKPLVLTCAMRPVTSLTPDGPQNVMDAVAVALDSLACGVLVVCAGSVHSARMVQKSHTYRLDAFDSGDAGPLAVVEEGRVRWFGRPTLPAPARVVDLHALSGNVWPRVEVVLSYAGASGVMVRSLANAAVAESPLRGLVVAGSGNGTVHEDLEAALMEIQRLGVRIVRASRCARGQVVQGETIPVFPNSNGLSPVKARIALMLELMA
ncbi:MAG: asparaginase [Curvibacter sp.]|nr:MAG: asparaginase [Curvibacter sp.]